MIISENETFDKRKSSLFSCILFTILLIFIFSDAYGIEDNNINEDDLFSETENIIDTKDIEDESVITEMDRPTLSLSGSIYNNNYYTTVRDDYILKTPSVDNDGEYTGSLTTNLLLDMRYKEGIKGFINADLIYYFRGIEKQNRPDKIYVDQALREYFFDFNIKRKVYFRIGRQYLKWGRNFFWNPNDLINVDKRDFLDPDKNLQGTRGIKIHIPFGIRYNIYGFINLEDHDSSKDIAWAGKFEFLVGDTEMSFSGWYKKEFEPVIGFDFSTRFFQTDIRGEMNVSRGENQESLLPVTDNLGNVLYYTTTRRKGQWFPKASIGFTRSYDLFEIDDRVIITGEFYYNHAGYTYNVFNNLNSLLALLQYGLYEPNYVSRYYGAVFLSIQQFIIPESTINMNVISNLIDNSGLIYSSLRYNPWFDFSVELSVSLPFGNGRDEYTFSGRDITLGIELRYNF